MKHRHYLVIASIIALPAVINAQVPPTPPSLPIEPIGAPKVPPVPTVPKAAKGLMHAIYGPVGDAFHLLDEPKIQGHIGDALYLMQEPKIRPPLGQYRDLIDDALLYAKFEGRGSIGYEISLPRQQTWYQEDPADSLFRAAHNLFSRQEYRPAALRFNDVRVKYPNSRYWCDAAFWEAFSRQRLGTADDLRIGYRVLDSMGTRCPNTTRREASADVPQLKARIDGALARAGDADAAERVRRAAGSQDQVCDSDERIVKIEALNTLANMDPATANPVLRTVLASKDPCSGPVRQQAIALVARRNDSESVATLLQIAKTDTDQQVQRSAVAALSRMTNDASVAAMEDLLRNSTDERTQYEAAAAMARSDHPRAQTAVRALIERRDVAERIRLNAISALASKENLSLDYWRTLYGRVESDQLRVGIINAIARINTDEAHNYLLSIARNPQESSDARRAAISRIQSTAPISELYKLLEIADSRSQRHSIVNALSSRKEAEATDRLIDIAKKSTDPEIRNAAIRALSQGTRKNDPKVIKALGEIISGVQP